MRKLLLATALVLGLAAPALANDTITVYLSYQNATNCTGTPSVRVDVDGNILASSQALTTTPTQYQYTRTGTLSGTNHLVGIFFNSISGQTAGTCPNPVYVTSAQMDTGATVTTDVSMRTFNEYGTVTVANH